MQGYGKTLLQQDEREYAERQSQALTNRQLALEEVRNRAELGRISYAGKVNQETYRVNKSADVDAKIAVLPAETRAAAALDTIKSQNAREERREAVGLEEGSKARIARLQSSLNISEASARIVAEAESKLRLGRQTVDRREILKDGAIAFYNANGDLIKKTAPGAMNPERAPDEDGGSMGSIKRRGALGREERTSLPAGTPTPTLPPPANGGAKPGDVAVDDQGREIRMNEFGRWVQIPPGRG